MSDTDGNILVSKNGFADNATVRDTFRLADGNYIFTIYDDGENGSGLMFPFDAAATAGNFLLKDSKDVTIYNAKPNMTPTSSLFA